MSGRELFQSCSFTAAAAALEALPAEEHCWCSKPIETLVLAGGLVNSATFGEAQQLWQRVVQELCACPSCIIAHHQAQGEYVQTLGAALAAQLLPLVSRLDQERLETSLSSAIHVHAGDPQAELPAQLVCGLFEALGFEELLEDEGVAAALEAALCRLAPEHELQLAQGGRYPGLYRLLAHPNSAVRAIVMPVVRELGRFADDEDVDCIGQLLQRWQMLLQYDLQQVPGVEGNPRARTQQPRQPLWLALNALFAMMDSAAMRHLLDLCPAYLDIALNCARTGSPASWAAVGCLKSMFNGAGPAVWRYSQQSADNIVSGLTESLLGALDGRLQVGLLSVFRPLASALDDAECGSGTRQRLLRKLLALLALKLPGLSGFPPSSQHVAGRAALDMVQHELQGHGPACLAHVHVYGPLLSRLVQGRDLPSALAPLQPAAVDLCCALLRADAMALSVGNAKAEAAGAAGKWQGPAPPDVAFAEAVVSHASGPSSSQWLCAPALWKDCAASTQPNLAVTMLSVASHLALAEEIAGAAQPSSMQAGAGFHSHAGLPSDFTTALAWPAVQGHWVGEVEMSPNSIRVARFPGLLLQHLREAAGALMTTLQQRTEPLQGFSEDHRAVAVAALMQLLTGVDATLRSSALSLLQAIALRSTLPAALQALAANEAVSYAVLEPLEVALSRAYRMDAAQFLLRKGSPALLEACSHVIAAATQRLQRAPSTEQVAIDGSQLAYHASRLLQHVMQNGRKAAQLPAAAPTLRHLLQMLPKLFLYDLQHSGPAGAVPEYLSWLHVYLGFGLECHASLQDTWADSLHQVLQAWPGGQDAHAWSEASAPPAVHAAAKRIFASSSALSTQAKLVLARHFPSAAPGNLSANPLQAFPQHLGARSDAALDLTKDGGDAGPSLPEHPVGGDSSRAVSGVNNSQSGHRPASAAKPSPPKQATLNRFFTKQTEPGTHAHRAPLSLSSAIASSSGRTSLFGNLTSHGSRQSSLQPTFVSSHAAKQPPRGQTRKRAAAPDGMDVEQLWPSAEDWPDASGAKRRPSTAPPPKKVSKLRAAMDRHDAEAGRVAGDSARPGGMPANHTLREPCAGTPEVQRSTARARDGAVAGNPRGPVPAVGHAAGTNRRSSSPAALAECALDDALGKPSRPAEAPKRPALAMPAAPKQHRKMIQLAAAPAAAAPWAKRRLAAATDAAAVPQVTVTIEEITAEILAWNFFEMSAPSGSRSWGRGARQAPTSFASAGEYVRTFRPLLVEELRAHLLQAREMMQASSMAGKRDIGDSLQITIRDAQRTGTMHNISFAMPASDRERCMLDDVLLLTPLPLRLDDGAELHQPGLHGLAMVERIEPDAQAKHMRVVHANVNLTSPHAADSDRVQGMFRALLPGSSWHATKIFSWTPHQRQFAALCKCHTLPHRLLDQILHPQPSMQPRKPLLAACSLTSGLKVALQRQYNPSQQAAVAACASSDKEAPFSLIQGPPGTGKTSVILGIISAALARGPVPSSIASGSPKAAETAPLPPPRRPLSANGSFPGNGNMPQKKAEAPTTARILACAQSNAAIDELVARLARQGVLSSPDGSHRVPGMVRMGKRESMHPDVQAFHMDCLGEKYNAQGITSLTSMHGEQESKRKRMADMQAELAEVRQKLQEAETAQKEQPGEGAPPAATIASMRARRRELIAKLDKARDEVRVVKEQVVQARREVRQAVVRQAEVVACTLSAAGGDLASLVAGGPLFDMVIVDEAAQALEAACLVALRLLGPGGTCVLVGDPQQLPATVISRAAEAGHLAQSLFERLQRADMPVVMLSEQYRMAPAISAFPSRFFYDSRLVDGAGTAEKALALDKGSAYLQPFAVFDCREGRERGGRGLAGGSLANTAEADLAAVLLSGLLKDVADNVGSIAVLSPYRAQVDLLRSRCSKLIPKADFSTVDGFQGKEADHVLFSCVRAHNSDSPTSSVGFLADVRRMNVALTRARRSLWVLGHARTLRNSPAWAALLEYGSSCGCLFHAQAPYVGILSASTAQLQCLPDRTALEAPPTGGDSHGVDTRRRQQAREVSRSTEQSSEAPPAKCKRLAKASQRTQTPYRGTDLDGLQPAHGVQHAAPPPPSSPPLPQTRLAATDAILSSGLKSKRTPSALPAGLPPLPPDPPSAGPSPSIHQQAHDRAADKDGVLSGSIRRGRVDLAHLPPLPEDADATTPGRQQRGQASAAPQLTKAPCTNDASPGGQHRPGSRAPKPLASKHSVKIARPAQRTVRPAALQKQDTSRAESSTRQVQEQQGFPEGRAAQSALPVQKMHAASKRSAQLSIDFLERDE